MVEAFAVRAPVSARVQDAQQQSHTSFTASLVKDLSTTSRIPSPNSRATSSSSRRQITGWGVTAKARINPSAGLDQMAGEVKRTSRVLGFASCVQPVS
jgi:hypothetical protein